VPAPSCGPIGCLARGARRDTDGHELAWTPPSVPSVRMIAFGERERHARGGCVTKLRPERGFVTHPHPRADSIGAKVVESARVRRASIKSITHGWQGQAPARTADVTGTTAAPTIATTPRRRQRLESVQLRRAADKPESMNRGHSAGAGQLSADAQPIRPAAGRRRPCTPTGRIGPSLSAATPTGERPRRFRAYAR
jgi:hypothetical protein